jgi:hypothetical protein
MIEIVRYRPEHGEYVASHMRHMDRKEIYYMSAIGPGPAVACTVAHAVAAWAALVDGVPVCIFGITRATRLSDIGVPWLLGTDALDDHGMALAVNSRKYFRRMVDCFPKMENHVLAENDRVVRWLRWLGFDMEEPAPYGAFGQMFIRFGKGLA